MTNQYSRPSKFQLVREREQDVVVGLAQLALSVVFV